MLEKVDLTKKLSKAEYKAQMPVLRNKLYDLEKACWDAGIPSVIVFEGWDAAGKGTSINLLTQRLDPRGFKLYAIQAPRNSRFIGSLLAWANALNKCRHKTIEITLFFTQYPLLI